MKKGIAPLNGDPVETYAVCGWPQEIHAEKLVVTQMEERLLADPAASTMENAPWPVWQGYQTADSSLQRTLHGSTAMISSYDRPDVVYVLHGVG